VIASALAGGVASATPARPALPLNQPSALAYSGGDIWVADAAADALTEVRAASGALVRQVRGTRYGFADPVALAARAGEVFVANADGNSVTEVDAATGARVRVLHGAAYGFRHPDAVAVSGSVVVVTGAEGSLSEFSARTGAVLAARRGHLDGPAGLVVTGSDVWVVNRSGNSVSEFRLTGAQWLRTVSASRLGLDAPAGIATDGEHLWVPNSGNDTVTELTARDGALVRIISGSEYGFNAPAPVAQAAGRVYVASPPGGSPMVTSLSAASGTVHWMMCNTNAPYQFADPQALLVVGSNVWVANASGNSLTVLNRVSGALRWHLT
jgi:DNA-binding beta-propeller fold protein YncE